MEDAVKPIKSFPNLTNKCVIYINVRQAEPCRDQQMDLLKRWLVFVVFSLAASLPLLALTKSHPVFESNVMDGSLLIEQNELAQRPPDGLGPFGGRRLRDIVLQ